MLRPLIHEYSGWKPNKTAVTTSVKATLRDWPLSSAWSTRCPQTNSLLTPLYLLNEPQAATVYKAVHNMFADGFWQPSRSFRALEHLRAHCVYSYLSSSFSECQLLGGSSWTPRVEGLKQRTRSSHGLFQVGCGD
ncbi:hypothetical protein BCR44DRAFT_271553 [Catenaria anguillulae PL171]|uniref:Uncharacterized protein n=1 Tax=Catenaria anguillulae PL171 TaxID=765915 RepID=A0A1Y2H9X9_9FUNG|nr:hypothetical protein BCR44DRAFT_271553 [Catenaria anguillulae PL171]